MSVALFAFYALWITPALLMALLAIVMRRRQLHREFPAFFAYAIFTAARTAILFFLFHRHPYVYSYLYWVAEGVSAALGFAAIYEVFRHLFPGGDATRRLGALFFRWTAAAFVLLAVLAAATNPQGEVSRLTAAVVAMAQGVRLVQCGLLLFLFVFSLFSGLAWRSQCVGIALGFGLFAGVQLAEAAVQALTGAVSPLTWSWINMASYNCAVLVWMTYLLAPQTAQAAAPRPMATEVRSWNQALLQLLLR